MQPKTHNSSTSNIQSGSSDWCSTGSPVIDQQTTKRLHIQVSDVDG